jgi:hypothetical protein
MWEQIYIFLFILLINYLYDKKYGILIIEYKCKAKLKFINWWINKFMFKRLS